MCKELDEVSRRFFTPYQAELASRNGCIMKKNVRFAATTDQVTAGSLPQTALPGALPLPCESPTAAG